LLAACRRVGDLRDPLPLEFDVALAARACELATQVSAATTPPALASRRLARAKGAPAALVQFVRERREILLRGRHHGAGEPVLVADVEDLLTREGAVSTHQDRLEASLEQGHQLQELLRRTLGARDVPRTVHQTQALLRLCQRNHQRMEAEAALAREVRAFFLV